MVEGSQQLKFADEAVAAEFYDMVGVVGAEANFTGTPMNRSSIEWADNNSNDASNQEKCNIWVMKENPTSPRSAQRQTRTDMVSITSPGGM